jgi:hypothetical protein
MGKSAVPTVAEMFSARVAVWQLGAMGTGVSVLAVSILAGSALGARVGALLFLSGVLLFISQLVRIAFGGRLEAVNG